MKMADIEVQHASNRVDKSKSTRQVKVGPVTIGSQQFAVIAGPCSIESESQFRSSAESVKSLGAQLLRGGMWKMRTSAQSFQGLGEESFAFVKRVQTDLNMQLVSEVTDPRQIEQIDDLVAMYQVGSRNMYNYALLKELGQTKKPVLLKRSFSALVDEWIKAAEYISQGGNENIILCERGIRTFETATRNTLDLNAVAYVKRYTDFPVIVDPSHGVGVKDLIAPMSLAAIAAGADGLLIEVHPNPKEALSDGKQALAVNDFELLMGQIKSLLPAFGKTLSWS